MEDEEKDLAKEMKDELEITQKYYEEVRLELDKIVLDNVLIEEIEKQNEQDESIKDLVEYNVYIKFNDENVKIATILPDGTLIPNERILENEKYTDEDKKQLGNMLNLLGLEQEKVDMSKLKAQLQELEAKTKEEVEKDLGKIQDEDESIKDEEEQDKEEQDNGEKKDDEQQKEDKDEKEKAKIAKKYNVSTKDIVHLNTKTKKLTENKAFADLVKWSEGREDVYIIANKLGSIEAVLEKDGDEYKEIEQNMKQTQGNIPNTPIHLVGRDKVETIVPLKLYEIDSKQAFATIRNNWGELETIYCRKQEGSQEYWGERVPEMSGKNVRQLEYKERSFMDPKNTSKEDLSERAKELERAEDRDERGVPSDKKGVQVEEIGGNSAQNIQLEKEKIKEDLYARLGIDEKMKAALMPGQLEYIERKIDGQADRIQALMASEEDITYENAVEQVEKEDGEREAGGITPGENRRRQRN